MTLDADFEALFHAHQRAITAYLTNLLGDPGRGQELAQETFLRAYRALARGVRVEHPGPGCTASPPTPPTTTSAGRAWCIGCRCPMPLLV